MECCLDVEADVQADAPAHNRPRTSDFYRTCNLPKRFEHPSWFYGYGVQKQPPDSPLYRTTASEYGRHPPSIHSVPVAFYPRNQNFSRKLAAAGMYRNYSLNTGLDPSPL